jgi:peroxiredoxin Q/BCP
MALCEVGTIAPDFVLQDQTGAKKQLSQLVKSGSVVLFFYPRDETTVCTLEACGFRDQHEEFVACGATVLGISPDSVESHAAFAKNHALPFTLLADPGGRVGASFGLKKTLGLLPGRATFVIDREQKVRLAFSSLLDAKAHIRNALLASRDL